MPPPLPPPERAGRQRGGPPCRPLSLRRPSSLHLLSRRPWHRRLRGRGRHAVWTEQTGGRGRRAGSPPRRRPCFGWSSSRRGPALLLLQLVAAATAPLLPSPSGRDGTSSSRGGGGAAFERPGVRIELGPVAMAPAGSPWSSLRWRAGAAAEAWRAGAAVVARRAGRTQRGGHGVAGRTHRGEAAASWRGSRGRADAARTGQARR